MNRLTEKEEEIMLLLWEYGPCSVKTLLDHMPDDGNKPHLNTVSTFVRILEQKGMVDHKPLGRGYIYFATVPKANYRDNAMGRLVKNFFGSNFSMVSQLVADEQLSADELRELLAIVENNGKSGKD